MKALFVALGGLMVSVNVIAHGGHAELGVAHSSFHGLPIALGIAAVVVALVAAKIIFASKK